MLLHIEPALCGFYRRDDVVHAGPVLYAHTHSHRRPFVYVHNVLDAHSMSKQAIAFNPTTPNAVHKQNEFSSLAPNSVAFDLSFDTTNEEMANDDDGEHDVICVMFNGFILCMHSTIHFVHARLFTKMA